MSETQNLHREHNFILFPYAAFGMGIDRITGETSIRSRTYHYHDCYELYYVYSGEFYSFIKDRSFLAQKGNMILVNDYDIHCTIDSAKPGYKRLILYFRKEFLEDFLDTVEKMELLKCFQKNAPLIRLTPQEQHSIETLLQSMLTEYQSKGSGYAAYLRTALIQLLILLNRHNGQLPDEQYRYASAAHKTISEITGYINNHYHTDITLTSISRQFFISPYYFTRIFKRSTGFTFIAYLNGVRVKEAQKLLRKTDLSIAQVAEAVGFKSSTHFGRIFKEITGITPLACRKRGDPEQAAEPFSEKP